jgi:hypothetical protein
MTKTAAKVTNTDDIDAVRGAKHMCVCHKEGKNGRRIREDRQGLIRIRGDLETVVSGFVGGRLADARLILHE